MILYDFTQKDFIQSEKFPCEWISKKDFFVLCDVKDITSIQEHFNFDTSTIIDRTDLDESIRFSNFDGYDFVSLVHAEKFNYELTLKEINLYISSRYIIMVLPENLSEKGMRLKDNIIKTVVETSSLYSKLNKAFYSILHILIADYSSLLENIEDNLEELQEQIIKQINKIEIEQINSYHKMTYTLKKQLRASSYIGTQLLVNMNNTLNKNTLRYFRNIDVSFKKIYGFAESLHELSKQLLLSYDSKLAMKTGEAVNKLTIVTVFLGPLTVITGIYGMNFSNMPELDWRFGYPAVIGLMIIVSAIIFWILKRKKWL